MCKRIDTLYDYINLYINYKKSYINIYKMNEYI